jgi:hypothetical protein
MQNNLIKKIPLDNGLELEFYDASKKVAGDRWRVKLTVKMDIAVQDYLEDMPSGMDLTEFKKVIGEKVAFEKTMERNFVDDKEKETISNEFLDSLSKSLVPYLSNANFPKRFIAKKYKEAQSRTNWYQD